MSLAPAVMPSGRTHDSITLWSLPLIAGLAYDRTHSSGLTLFVSGSYLFSGLMFGPDLDVYSQQYRRWGWLRWIWLPYRRSLRHRSFWSHGFIVGTVVRVVYLFIWVAALGAAGILLGAIAYHLAGITNSWIDLAQQWGRDSMTFIERSSQQYPMEAIAIAVGLELGSLSHSLSDWVLSAIRRTFKRRSKKASTPSRTIAASTGTPLLAKDAIDQASFSEQSGNSTASPIRREPQLPPFGRRRGEG